MVVVGGGGVLTPRTSALDPSLQNIHGMYPQKVICKGLYNFYDYIFIFCLVKNVCILLLKGMGITHTDF